MPPIRGASGRRTATLDYWDDPTDVWALRLAAGERLLATITGRPGMSLRLLL